MRAINLTKRFKRDYRREKSGVLGKKLDALLREALEFLAADAPLPPRYSDHPLIGEWKDHRDCHIRPDPVLITGSRTRTVWNSCGSVLIAS